MGPAVFWATTEMLPKCGEVLGKNIELSLWVSRRASQGLKRDLRHEKM
jgi:hypothetical protein